MICANSPSFVAPLSRLLRGSLHAASRPSKDVQADNNEFCCRAAASLVPRCSRQVVTVTLRNRTVVIGPHADLRASLLALNAGIPARDAAGSRPVPREYTWHVSCNRAAAVPTCEL